MHKIHIYVVSFVYCLLLLYAMISYSFTSIVFLVILPFAIVALLSPTFSVLLPVVLISSGLYIPGLGGANLMLYNLASIAAVGVMLAGGIIRRKGGKPITADVFCAAFLVLWILLLMWLRGSGMRILGSNQHGGGVYIQSLASLLFFISTRNKILPLRHLRTAGLLLGALSVLPLFAFGAFELSGGRISWQMMFFKMGASTLGTAADIQRGLDTRLTFLSGGMGLFWLAIFGWKQFLFVKIPAWFWWSIAFVSAALSGFRSTLILISLTAFSFRFLRSRRRGQFLMLAIICCAVGYMILWFTVPYLPFSVQRSVSILPGIHVTARAGYHGMGTVLWRVMLWRRALIDLPQYWFIGRGVAFNYESIETMAMQGLVNVEYANAIGALHQATLELLLLYGLPFLLACIVMYFFFISKSYFVLLRQHLDNNQASRWKMGLASYIACHSVSSFLWGTSSSLLAMIPIYMAFYNLINNSESEEMERNT